MDTIPPYQTKLFHLFLKRWRHSYHTLTFSANQAVAPSFVRSSNQALRESSSLAT